MSIRYRTGVALTSVAFVIAVPARSAGACLPAMQQPATDASLYSRRVLRRERRLLEFQLLELRKARLERVRQAILLHVPVDELLEGSSGTNPKHSHATCR